VTIVHVSGYSFPVSAPLATLPKNAEGVANPHLLQGLKSPTLCPHSPPSPLAGASKEALWLYKLWADLKFTRAPVAMCMYEDNQSALALIETSVHD
jgi:hypothetical protein